MCMVINNREGWTGGGGGTRIQGWKKTGVKTELEVHRSLYYSPRYSCIFLLKQF